MNSESSPTIPQSPANLRASAISESQIDLTWEDNSSNETGFSVERRADSETDFTEIASGLPAGTTSYSSIGLNSDITYHYRVAAYNALGNSPYSNEAYATTNDIIPFAPSGLVAIKASSSQINLTWNDNSDNEDGYKIERRAEEESGFTEIESSWPADSTSYSDNTLVPDTTYYYQIRAFNPMGDSGYSNESSATTDDVVPADPSGLTATPISHSQINLGWADNSSNESGFIIQRSTDDIIFTEIATVLSNVTTYNNIGLSESTTYYYRVYAYNGIGNSTGFSAASATTLAGGSTEAIIIDHTCIALTSIPASRINNSRANLHIAYGHTSHGSQLTDGMTGLLSFKPGYDTLYAWNNGGTGGALDLHDYAMGGDCGYYPQWVDNTRSYLGTPDPVTGRGTGANADVNVIIWSWCGQVSSKTEATMLSEYLLPMTQLENDYPGITFVYMTGHLDGTGLTGDLHLRNNQIRNYCIANHKVLYDFEDIESYDPSGVYYGNKTPNDYCAYDSDGNGSLDKNWAEDWQNAHPGEWFNCTAAHSWPVNGNMKAYAAWWLWARIGGWDGI